MFFIAVSLYVDKQIFLYNYSLAGKQADIIAGNQEYFQAECHVCMVTGLCINMFDSKQAGMFT